MRSILFGVLLAMMTATAAYASPCRDNYWQPTYVHDLMAKDGPYYVMPGGGFAKVAEPYTSAGPAWCAAYGVRGARGFTNCANYTRVQCGCDANSFGNSTCAAFLTAKGYRPGAAAPPVVTGSGSQTLTVTNERPEKVRTSFATVAGAIYQIDATGVFSDWGDKSDGVDPVWCYAAWRCGNGEVWDQLRINGHGMSELTGGKLPYNPGHSYSILVRGDGNPIELYLADAQGSSGDNHGYVTVTVHAR